MEELSWFGFGMGIFNVLLFTITYFTALRFGFILVIVLLLSFLGSIISIISLVKEKNWVIIVSVVLNVCVFLFGFYVYFFSVRLFGG